MPLPTRIGTQTQQVQYSASFTVPADCTYVVALISRTNGAGFTATLGGVAMTLAVSVDNTDSTLSAIFTQASPLTGSRSLVVSSAGGDYRCTLVYYKDVGATPIVATSSAGGAFTNSFSLNATSEADAEVLDVIGVQATGTLTNNSAQTLIDNTSTSSPAQMFGTSYRAATGTPTAMAWTSSASQRQAHCAIAIRGGTPATTPFRAYYAHTSG